MSKGLSTLFGALAQYSPTLVGTFPLGLVVAGSDLDVACSANDLARFEEDLQLALRALQVDARAERISIGKEEASVTGFELDGTPVEVFCQRAPVTEQHGFRHMIIEGRLLAIGGAALRELVLAKKRAGMKTEPAFAEVLGLEGDPYQAMLTLESASLERLQQKIQAGLRRASGAPPLVVEQYEGDREALRGLLRLADDSDQQIDRYLRRGVVFIVREADEVVAQLLLAEALIVDGDMMLEIKNMSVSPRLQGTGLGRQLVAAAIDYCKARKTKRLVVATATAGIGQLRFYQKLGFRFLSIEKNVFTPANGYPEMLVEDGIQLLDQVWLARTP